VSESKSATDCLPDVLLLSGWSVPVDTWRGVVASSSPAVHCRFDGCTEPDDFVATAGDALSACASEVTVIGWSLGAMVGLELAHSHPDRVRRMCLVGATDRFVAQPGDTVGWSTRVLERMERAVSKSPDEVLQAFDDAMFSPTERAGGAIDAWRAIVGRDREPVASLRAGLRYLAHFQLDPSEISTPIAVLHGEADTICPVGGARRLVGGLTNGTLEVWPDAGHAPFVAQPDRFAAWLGAAIVR
jgi:pimeloyl-[acyl-carrier protein] methyl ester esterase